MTFLHRTTIAAVTAAVLLTWAPAVHAEQDVVAWVAAVAGDAELLRPPSATWGGIAPADELIVGDQVRTLAGGHLKLLMRDDSIVTLGESSHLVLAEQLAGDAPVSSFSLLVGQARALANERYGAAGARFEVTTPTAIAGVRGTEFYASYEQRQEETLVVGIAATTNVRSRIDSSGARAVMLGPGQGTRVRRGAFPSRPTRVPASQMNGLISSTTVSHALQSGAEAGGGGGGTAAQSPGAKSAASPSNKVVDQPADVFGRGGRGVPPPPPVP